MKSAGEHPLLHGKLNRREFAFFFFASTFAYTWAFAVELPPVMTETQWAVALLMLAIIFVVQIFLALMRCRDIGRSGWFLLIWFIPTIGTLWVLGELLFRPGKVAT